jgi:pimeloyl-ACP methyl ester carboxylesterase
MTTIKRAYRDSRYGQLHFRIGMPVVQVDAPPLLCFHQTPSNSHEWMPLLPGLAQGRVVVAVDTPGYGNSDPPPAPVTIDTYGEIMTLLVDDLTEEGIIPAGPFDVMGVHTGSLIATELAVKRPTQVRRAVLFGLAAYPADLRAEKLASLPARFPPPDATLDHIEKLWAFMGHFGDPRMTMQERHVAMAECLRLGARMPWAYEAVYRYDFLAALELLSQPVLVVNPEDDLHDVTRKNSGRILHGERLDLPGCKHGFMAYEAEMLVERIAAFLT